MDNLGLGTIGTRLAILDEVDSLLHNDYTTTVLNELMDRVTNTFETKYQVHKEYPFTVKKVEKTDESILMHDARLSNGFSHTRRLDAEKASLEKQIEYIKTSKEFYEWDKDLVFGMIRQLEYQLENIEEEHPEWII